MVDGKLALFKSASVVCAGTKAGTSLHGSSNAVPRVKLPEKGEALSIIVLPASGKA